MLLSTTALAVLVAVLYIIWKGARYYVVPSSVDNLQGPPSVSFFKGNLGQMFGLYGWDWHKELVETYGGIVKLRGWFGVPWLYVTDPTAVQAILGKDSYVFESADFFLASSHLMFGPGLLATRGALHRKQRKLLNPAFSTGAMRDVLPILYPIAHKLRESIAAQIKRDATPTSDADRVGSAEVNVLYWMSRAALEFIGQAGLGYSFDALALDESENPYTHALKQFIPTLARLTVARQLLPTALSLLAPFPPSVRRALADRLPSPNLHKLLSIVDTMSHSAEEVYAEKKRALAAGEGVAVEQVTQGRGKDIMSVLMRANAAASLEDRLPEAEVLGQMNTFLFAGSDTTSTALTRVLHLLALHPAVQTKLRHEVTQARMGGDLTYDELMALPYLDAVVRESLRMYTPISVAYRSTLQDTVIPLSTPVSSRGGESLTSIPVEKGTQIMISMVEINRSKAIWGADAREWKPERWLSDESSASETGGTATGKAKVEGGSGRVPGIYSNMMTFLGGGRACIGYRFALLEMKVVLSILIESFTFAPLDNTEIAWTMPGIAMPLVKGAQNRVPHLPLKVGVVQPFESG